VSKVKTDMEDKHKKMLWQAKSREGLANLNKNKHFNQLGAVSKSKFKLS